jgi:aspartyl/glutamyl-tRNA(Asn/Gln) amidotransferase C subunit
MSKVKGQMSNVINIDNVENLANLPLSGEEEKTYSDQLSKILEYIDQIEKGVDIGKVEPTFNVTMNKNVMRKDKSSKSLTQHEAISNARSKKMAIL